MPGAIIQESANSAPSQASPLTVLVAGAGIGGLTAALGLRAQGHTVHVFEQSRLANEVGAAIHVAPNANVILRRLGVRLEQGYDAQLLKHTLEFDQDMNIMTDHETPDMEKLIGTPYHLMHRAHLHAAIKDKAVEQDVNLHTSSRIAEARADTGELVLENGEVWKGDVVIGADGVHSHTRTALPGTSKITPFASGRSGYRFLVPMKAALAQPHVSSMIRHEGQVFKIHLGQGRIFVGYPCVNNTTLNCFAVCPTADIKAHEAEAAANSTAAAAGKANKDWNQVASKETMLAVFDTNIQPAAREILELADPAGVRLWDLIDMGVLPTWVNGKYAGLGDAVHPFTPWRGQGGAMAIEDAGSLAAVLPLGTAPQDVPERLRLYQSLRYDRATEMQDISRRFGGKLRDTTAYDVGDDFDPKAFEKKILLHDEWKDSEAALQKMVAVA